MKKALFILTLFLFLFSISFASGLIYEPYIEWQKFFSGNSSNTGYAVQKTSDGGYIVVGRGGGGDVFLLKTDSQGNLQWEKTFGESRWYEYGASVQQTSDGGYIIGGTKDSSPNANDVAYFYLIKTDSQGNLQWQKTFSKGRENNGRSVQQAYDGGYIILGDTDGTTGVERIYIVKTDANGNLQWSRTYGPGSWDYYSAFALEKTSDNNYILVGYIRLYHSPTSTDLYLAKMDQNGNILWSKSHGSTVGDYGYSVQQTIDNGYIATGGDVTPRWIYLIKTDSIGNKEWEKRFLRPYYAGRTVRQTNDLGYIIATGGLLIKTDSNGNIQWEKSLPILDIKVEDNGYIGVGGGYLTKLKNPTCNDNIKNQDETDIDCGGSCSSCSIGKICQSNKDCTSNYCYANACTYPSCSDSIQNGYEEGIDCGWACGNSCSKCISVINNGDSNSKIDVVFVGSGFPDLNNFSQAVNEAIDYNSINYGLMYYEPFKSYKDRFNFWRVEELKTFSSYESESKFLAREICPFMDQLILLSVTPRFQSHAYAILGHGNAKAFVTIGNEYITNSSWPLDIDGKTYGSTREHIIRTFVHEFGHSFGGLEDEYNSSSQFPSLLTGPNCDGSSCSKWSNISDAQCIPGCKFGNWYRAYYNTLMKSQYYASAIFEKVNERELLKDILEKSVEAAASPAFLPETSYDLSYILNLNYNNGAISSKEVKLVSGQASPPSIGDYTLNIISFNNNSLFSTNFSFSLEAVFAPPADWFDENGNQIVTPAEPSTLTIDATNESFSLPYFNNAETISTYYPNSTLALTINVSQYHDLDNDVMLAIIDNCPFIYNPSQEDIDLDGLGNECDDLPGDANKDGRVDANDLAIVRTFFGTTNAIWEQGDFNADSKVDATDLSTVRTFFGFIQQS